MQHQKKRVNKDKKVLLLIKGFVVHNKCTQKAVNNAAFQGSPKHQTEQRNKE